MSGALIVGGGISGLSAAYYMSRSGVAATLVERQPRLGGVIRTERVEGCLLEAGPDSFLAAKPWALKLIRELGLAGEVIGSNDHVRKTYVVKRGRLRALPDGLMLMVPTRILPLVTSNLLSWGAKLRMGLEWFRRVRPSAGTDRSVADFIRDHYGTEAVDYLAEPLLAGVYGGSPELLSVAAVLPRFVELEARYGSLTRGVLAARRQAAAEAQGLPLFQTLRGGLGRLVEALEAAARPALSRLCGSAETMERSGAGYRIRVGGEWLEAEQVVLACPGYEAAAVLEGLGPQLAALLAAIPYTHSITLSLGYRKTGFAHPLNGFGFLVPRRERRRLVACTWVNTKFSHRVPEDKVVLRCFLGDDEGALREGDESLVGAVREELARLMGVTAEPIFARVARWPRSMAQYTVGHLARLEEIRARLAGLPGLHLAGNAYSGIGVPDCVRTGKQAAEAMRRGTR
ncbi:MAG: protoporphyrinogen oxidase [Acidobacteria bacterium]|nr:protoporphyrinogen oxidase [Acidobacteriota bacterium]